MNNFHSKRSEAMWGGLALACLAALVAVTAAHAGDSPTAPIEARELVERIEENQAPLILDVRTKQEFDAGHIPGALHIPHDEVANRLAELPEDKSSEIVVHCQSGRRAGMARTVLEKNGYTGVRDLAGHWKAWSASGRPVEKDE